MNHFKYSKLLAAIIGIGANTALLTHAQNTDPTYLVYLNPFIAQEYLEEEIRNGYTQPEFPIILKKEEKSRIYKTT